MNTPKRSREVLVHFSCEKCLKWWSVSDAPDDKEEWFCPWCGHQNNYKDTRPFFKKPVFKNICTYLKSMVLSK